MLLTQAITTQKAQSRKKAHKPLRISWISWKMCLSQLIIIKSFLHFDYTINTLAAWSAFRALFTWSPRTTCAKDHGLFYLNYPQINEVGNSDHMIMLDVHYGACKHELWRSRRETVLLGLIFNCTAHRSQPHNRNRAYCFESKTKWIFRFLQDDEEPEGTTFSLDGAYIPRIFFLGWSLLCLSRVRA